MSAAPTSPSGPSGFLLVDKPAGMTSHDVVGRVRRWAGTRKVGHAGTLDPAATGLLLLGVGQATRLLSVLILEDKQYQSTFVLGQATSTDDAQGQVLATLPVPPLPGGLRNPQLVAAAQQLSGVISQVPPQVSAIKVQGKRAYALARAGQQVDLSARRVHIHEFQLVQIDRADPQGLVKVQVQVHCSSGTYIRSLARDLGVKLGTLGHVGCLRRTAVGPWKVEQALALAQLSGSDPVPVEQGLLPMARVAHQCMETVEVDDALRGRLRHGMALRLSELDFKQRDLPEHSSVVVLDNRQEVVAVAVVREGKLRPRAVLNTPNV